MLKSRILVAAAAVAFGVSAARAQAPAESVMVFKVNVAGVVGSPLYKQLATQLGDKMNNPDPKYQEFKTATGFNPETDLTTMVVGLGGDFMGGAPPKVFAIIEGKFDQAKIEEFAKSKGSEEMTVEQIDGLTTFTGKESSGSPPPTMAFLDGKTMVIAAKEDFSALVKSVKGGTGVPMASGIKALLDQEKGQISLAMILPAQAKDQLKAQAQFAALANLQTVMLGVDVGADVNLSLKAAADSDANGKAVFDVLNGLLAMGKMATAEQPDIQKVVNELKLEQQGASSALSLSVKAEDISKIVTDAMNKGSASEEATEEGASEEDGE